MGGDDFGHLIYLSLLVLVIGGSYVVSNRHNLNKMAQQLMIWVFIFVGMVAVVGLWQDIRGDLFQGGATQASEQMLETKRAPDGHFYLEGKVNDAKVLFLVDTGATSLVLSREDAQRAGIDVDGLGYFGTANTANGTVATAITRLDRLKIGAFEDRNIRAAVNAGDMNISLLGMDYLQRFSQVSIEGNSLILQR